MKVLKNDMNSADLHAEMEAAESVRRKSGHSELCRYRPMTDQDTAVSVVADRGRSNPRRIIGKAMGTRNCTDIRSILDNATMRGNTYL
jgi:hypothetical protein